MLSWLVDHATLLYVILISVGLLALAGWWQIRKRPFAIGFVVSAVLLGFVFASTLFVDTDRKQIERNLRALAAGMRETPPAKMFALFSKNIRGTFLVRGNQATWNFKEICTQVTRGQAAFQIADIAISDIQIKEINGREATVLFDAMPVGATIKYFPCEAKFVKEDDGVWRMRALKIFDPDNQDQLFNIPM
jgi:hypothetical protein